MRITLVHNPTAGNEDHKGKHLQKLIRDAGHEVVYQSSKDDLYKALKDPGDLVVVAGGDGTVRKTALQIIDLKVPIAIMPMGTANNISKSLGISGTPEELIAHWPKAKHKKFPVGMASSSWGKEMFIEGLGLGIFARAISLLERIDKQAPQDFSSTYDKLYRDISSLIILVAESNPTELKITIDGKDYSGPYLFLEVMNMNFIGPNLHLAPEADPSDNHLNFVFLSEANRENFANYLTKRFSGKDVSLPVDMVSGYHMQIHWQGTEIHLDDKLWTNGMTVPSKPQTIDVKVENKFLEFLV